MKRIKRILVSIGLVFGITFGGLVISAPAAQAFQDCCVRYEYNCPWQTRYTLVYRDYNWWEEVFQWKVDGWVIIKTDHFICYYY